jgi:cell division septum initiation protein DivIVA
MDGGQAGLDEAVPVAPRERRARALAVQLSKESAKRAQAEHRILDLEAALETGAAELAKIQDELGRVLADLAAAQARLAEFGDRTPAEIAALERTAMSLIGEADDGDRNALPNATPEMAAQLLLSKAKFEAHLMITSADAQRDAIIAAARNEADFIRGLAATAPAEAEPDRGEKHRKNAVMPAAPEFTATLRGYQPTQVDAFVRWVESPTVPRPDMPSTNFDTITAGYNRVEVDRYVHDVHEYLHLSREPSAKKTGAKAGRA